LGRTKGDFLKERKNKSQTNYLDKGIAEGMSAATQLQQIPLGVTKAGASS